MLVIPFSSPCWKAWDVTVSLWRKAPALVEAKIFVDRSTWRRRTSRLSVAGTRCRGGQGWRRSLALYDPATYKLRKGNWRELSYIDLTPAVSCRLEGNREALFKIDTGYVGTVTFYDKYIEDENLLAGRPTQEDAAVGAAGTYKVLTGSISWFELAGSRFNDPKVDFRVVGLNREGGAGVVGRVFLSAFTIVFDYPDRRITFVR